MSTYNGDSYVDPRNINLRGGASGSGLIRWHPVPTGSNGNWATNPFGTTDYGLYVNSSGQLVFSSTGTPTVLVTPGGGGSIPSFNAVYSVAQKLTVAGTTFTIDNATNDATNVLTLTNTGTGSGVVLQITNVGTGSDISGTGATWSFSKAGAGTFKQEILPYLAGKNVYLLYDNDLAGQNGIKKVSEIICSITAKTFKIVWPKNTKSGYDVRDIFKDFSCDHQKTIDCLMRYCQLDKTQNPNAQVMYTDELVKPNEVYETFKKWLHMPDTTVIDVVFGTALANRIPGDPLWMYIVAVPGGTKTVVAMSLTEAQNVIAISSLTSKTLISGANFGGNDPSLIPRLNGKMLLIKEFTNILSLPEMELDEIMGILRDAYDGECYKPFGNGIFRKYKSKFGILACVTPVIEQYTESHAARGERFLRFDSHIPTGLKAREPFVDRAMDNIGKEPEMQADFSAIAKRVLIGNYSEIPTIPDEIKKKIARLAQWVSVLRGTVTRDKYFNRDITHKSIIELGTRLAKQLCKAMLGISMFRQNKIVTDETYKIAVSIAKASVSPRYYDVVKAIYRKDIHTLKEIQAAVGLPAPTITMLLDNLIMLGAVEKDHAASTQFYLLKPDLREIMEFCNL